MRRRFALTCLVFALASCGSALMGSDYPGQPLFELLGVVAPSDALPPVEGAIVWQVGDPPSTDSMQLAVRTGAPELSVTNGYFWIGLYDPPPPELLRSLGVGEPGFVRGNAAAIPYRIEGDQLDRAMATRSGALGLDVFHWIVWLEDPAPPGSRTAWWLGGSLERGYHFLRVDPVDPQCMTGERLTACLTELAEIGVTDDVANEATALCRLPYRLHPETGFPSVGIALGTYDLPPLVECAP